MPDPVPFHVDIPEHALEDLRARLAAPRYPIDPGNADWRYGTSRRYLEEFVGHWRDSYDWRLHETAMNRFDHFRVELDDVPIHFVHQRGKGPNRIPLIMSHGWPWTFWDLAELIGPLSDPAAYGGDPVDAFDVVVPSLPGFGFSSPLTRTGVGGIATARLWHRLMTEVLGYRRFGAQGGDFGAIVTQHMAQLFSDDLIGVHMSRYKRPADAPGVSTGAVGPEDYGPDEQGEWERHQAGMPLGASHLAVHSHDPQTLAYGLHDSPVALAAWILERRRAWSDCGGDVERTFSRDHLVTTVMLYWLTETAVTSARYYWETAHEERYPLSEGRTIEVPTAVGVLPRDVIAMPRRHAEEDTDLRSWTRYTRGGHFGPAEVPGEMVEDLRAFFRPLRVS